MASLTFRLMVELRQNQIRSVDRRRLVKKLGTLDAATMRKVDEALVISLGLINI
jgi:mRNA-degrading endonuclease toxin of MazEF toxin-antitoxin module